MPSRSQFRGIPLFQEQIPIRSETCELCNNHCRLRIAAVQGETVAYGFLCGRDYETKRFVQRDSTSFDFLKEHRRIWRSMDAGKYEEDRAKGNGRQPDQTSQRQTVIVGLPAALHLLEELPLWRRFFSELGVQTLTSEDFNHSLEKGKDIMGAEFCAPVAVLHGHVRLLAKSCDRVFLPIYMEAPKSGAAQLGKIQRFYCYYTQFVP